MLNQKSLLMLYLTPDEVFFLFSLLQMQCSLQKKSEKIRKILRTPIILPTQLGVLSLLTALHSNYQCTMYQCTM